MWYSVLRRVERLRLKDRDVPGEASLLIRAEAGADDMDDRIALELDADAMDGLRAVLDARADGEEDAVWERDGP